MTTPATKTYRVVTPLDHDNVRHEPGATVTLPSDIGDPLVEDGVLGEPAPDPDPDSGEAGNRIRTLADAIGRLDRDDADAWTKSGAPDISALAREAGLEDVTAAERDDAWLLHQGSDGD